MHRIDGAGATSDNRFTEGDPTQGVPATTVTGAWLNALQEEIANVIESAGMSLAKPDNTQMAAAIRAIISANQVQAWYTGDVRLTMRKVADDGWLLCNDGTIGKTGSAGTARANDDTEALFKLLWNNVADGFAPVSGGRGSSADADWNAGKTIGLTRMLGRALAVAGHGSGLSSRSLGQILGTETHTLTATEMPSHAHGVNDPGHAHSAWQDAHTHDVGGVATGRAASGYYLSTVSSGYENRLPVYPNSGATNSPTTTGASANGVYVGAAATGISIQANGGGAAHNNMQPTAFLNAMVKL